MMEPQSAKEQVIRAGLELVRSGLIARTWGNVSCRIDDDSFAITPSGRSYETLTPEDIVICKIADASYSGTIKPSSEKGIHALVYRSRPDIGFVIHTHQKAASAISVSSIGIMPPMGRDLLGSGVPVAAYGLPGTKKLRNGVGKALEQCSGHALIMAHHGALCFGRDYNEAFASAQKLEAACFDFLRNAYLKKKGTTEYLEDEFYRFCAAEAAGSPVKSQNSLLLYSSQRTENGFLFHSDKETTYCFSDTNLSKEAMIHKAIYQSRKEIRFIRQDTEHGLLALSQAQVPLLPWLDDFAQIAGSSVRCAESTSPEAIEKALQDRMGVLVPGGGALCCAAEKSDVHALELVMEKNALAQMSTHLLNGGQTLGIFDCRLMHFVYTKSYSKQASQLSLPV